MNGGRKITIVLCLNGTKVSGVWQSDPGASFKTIRIRGECQDIAWEHDTWVEMLSNIQFNPASDRCRVMVVSRRKPAECQLPCVESSWDWSMSGIFAAIPCDIKPYARIWAPSAANPEGTYQDSLFPACAGEREFYIRTVPVPAILEPSEGDTPPGETVQAFTGMAYALGVGEGNRGDTPLSQIFHWLMKQNRGR